MVLLQTVTYLVSLFVSQSAIQSVSRSLVSQSSNLPATYLGS